ncbi:ketopantoate reductase family protein [Methylovirgula sp. 4M-Z18]|uniref:ketopantoate reductase family protein n=1 Tax=Methylovirgula sp. 4M-Z18 TaxID=2293567 RepID=UPI000E2F0D6C|nr:2-dehydropantoate 2-reductase [Methylovirgula sp. 4M-Z18]RFB78579.1 2-dehydropantoate 2-reductase [Methylovirgula sp. 4M-Z18]
MEIRKIAVVGAGSVGAVVAWHLARAGFNPSIVARSASAALLQRDGLTLGGAGNDETVRMAVTDAPASLGPQDLVLVGFKAHDWPGGLPSVLPLIGPDTIVVPLLNGIPWWFFQGYGGAHDCRTVRSVDPDERLVKTVPPAQILGGVVYVGAERVDAAHVTWNGRKTLVLGEPSGGISERLTKVVAVLSRAGFEAQASDAIRDAVWRKLFGNISFNPLSVVAGATIGRMLDHPPLRRILVAMIAETVAVAGPLGLKGTVDIEARLNMPPSMLDFKTSMLQDFEAGRPLELGALSGAVGELAELVGVKTPMIDAIGALAAERSLAPAGKTIHKSLL